MRHVILGASGQLGQEFGKLLDGEVTRLTRAEADLTRPEIVEAILAQLSPDVVLNCAAYNLVDRAETEPEVAFAVNGIAVGELARLCLRLDCILVHFSTDHVFGDRQGPRPLTEADIPGPVNLYGRSKLAGEEFLRAQPGLRYLLIRTCGLYGETGMGGKGGNFVETILRRARAGLPLRVVRDQVCTPTCTTDLAQAVLLLLERGAFGLYHLTNAGSCSWFEFAQHILDLGGIRADLTAITSAELGSRAPRPRYSVLDHVAWGHLGLPPFRPWKEALAAYLASCP